MKNIYFGNVDALKPVVSENEVVVLDGSKLAYPLQAIANVSQWQAGRIQLQLINGQDVPNTDGLYLCTDSCGNVRYGLVTATAANCFRFQEQYANGGHTVWLDKANASRGAVEDGDLDMSELCNWLLLLPTVSANLSDASKFPEHYKPDTSATPCSIVSNPCDNRTEAQKYMAETYTDEEVPAEREDMAKYTMFRWSRNLRGTALPMFIAALSNFLDRTVTKYTIADVRLEEWRKLALHLSENDIGPKLLNAQDIKNCQNIFILARSCYFRIVGKLPTRNEYYDHHMAILTNA